ncbi:shieldin complex subunit 3 isoform X2 [Syngnathus acus]|uniref:shieldin complex subunit 3 isoform X2 n=1 Tax=Syngnathus acus TaxID=161584 RepID=UPI001885E2FA|nr:shieldin complex subunit 3 isoform X2 [Syngnathus acus]
MMQVVILHHRLKGSDGLRDLIATTEKLLEPFPCRPPSAFTPWFLHSSAQCPLPIRPAKRAPVINAAAAVKRSWSVLASKDVHQVSPSLSKRFRCTVSVHALHPRQRSKWVISRHNCGATRDIEQVWRALSSAARHAGLPTCNANIQRERAEIWVFCDVAYSEQVGHFLKEHLQLSGSIRLCVHKLGEIFSL